MNIKPCTECKKYSTCTKLCPKADRYSRQDWVYQREIPFSFMPKSSGANIPLDNLRLAPHHRRHVLSEYTWQELMGFSDMPLPRFKCITKVQTQALWLFHALGCTYKEIAFRLSNGYQRFKTRQVEHLIRSAERALGKNYGREKHKHLALYLAAVKDDRKCVWRDDSDKISSDPQFVKYLRGLDWRLFRYIQSGLDDFKGYFAGAEPDLNEYDGVQITSDHDHRQRHANIQRGHLLIFNARPPEPFYYKQKQQTEFIHQILKTVVNFAKKGRESISYRVLSASLVKPEMGIFFKKAG